MDKRAKPAQGLALGLSSNSSVSAESSDYLLPPFLRTLELEAKQQRSVLDAPMPNARLMLIAGETPFPGENDLPRPVASKNAALFKFQSLGYMPGDTDRSFGEVPSTATGTDS